MKSSMVKQWKLGLVSPLWDLHELFPTASILDREAELAEGWIKGELKLKF